MRNNIVLGALAAAVLNAAAPAAAVTIDFTNITAEWFDVVQDGGPALGFTGNGTANASVRWGNDIGFGRSGYDFEAVGIPQLSLTPPGVSAVTDIGLFRHVNQPINFSILSARLRFNTDVVVDGSLLTNVSFVYDFGHDETTNNLAPCPYGGANAQGVNINGCADRVLTNFNRQSEFFTIGSTNYTLDIVGFLVGNPGVQTTSFLTTERTVNEALIRGRVVRFEQAVPEPATWAMLIAGFGLVGAVARRRRMALSAA